jgi:hypothetical protein
MNFESPHLPTGETGEDLEFLNMIEMLVRMDTKEFNDYVSENEITPEELDTLRALRAWADRKGRPNA